ncbi:MAG: Hsp20/alpha crystallin family protein [Thermoprotei archaeon]
MKQLEEESDALFEEMIEDMEGLVHMAMKSDPFMFSAAPQICTVQKPAFQISKSDNELRILVDLPYVDPKTVEVKIAPRRLWLRALTREDYKPRIRFELDLALPSEVKLEETAAKLHGEVLDLKLKKNVRTTIPVD